MDRFIRLRGHQELALVIEVQREHRRGLVMIVALEELEAGGISYEWTIECIRNRLTLVGRKFEIISLTFAMAGTLIPDLERPMPPFALGAGLGESTSIGVELMVEE